MRAWVVMLCICGLPLVACSGTELTGTDLGSTGGSASSGTSSTTGGGTTGYILPAAVPFTRSAAPNPIVAENQKPGDWDWYLTKESPNGEIEGYASDVSAEAGDSIDFMISTSVESDYTYSVYRFGYYGGTGARKVVTGPTLHASPGAPCPADPDTELVECDWPVGFSLTIPNDWVSGAYFVKLHRADGYERYIPFIVRDHRAAEILFKAAVDTDEAYNRWGGESLYYDSSHRSPSGMGFKVSFDRPFNDGAGMYSLLWWEQHAIRFLERNGYDVTYGTNVDANRFSGFYDGIGAIVTAGHDEYWSQRERDVMNQVVSSGQTSIVNLTANAGYWRIRYEPDAHGRPWRNIACYKAKQNLDPLGSGPLTTTARFRDAPNAQPENGLFGNMYDNWALMGFPLVIGDVSNPLFANSGFTPGDIVPELVGYEYDMVFNNGFQPPGTTVLASSPILNAEDYPATAQVVVRTTPQGRTVFSAGSIYWPLALSEEPNWEDTRIWKLTWNVLEQALSHRHAVRPAPQFALVTHDDPAPVARYASVIAPVAGKPGLLKAVDGPAAQAGFAGPTGIAVAGDGTVFVADANAHTIRMIRRGAVTTIAGDGTAGNIDGPGLQARFREPTGLAIGPDGALYVADAEIMSIRRIDLNSPDHTVSTYAGSDAVYAGFADGPGAQAYFNRPTSIAFEKSGELYVVDEENNLIRKVANDAAHTVTTFAGTWNGYQDGPLLQAAFNYPTGITIAPDGTIYILDSGNGLIRRIRPGSGMVDTVAGTQGIFGCVDGSGDQAELRGQLGILWMPSGVLFTDSSSNKVRQVVDGVDAAHSSVTTFAGNGQVGASLSTPDASNIVAPGGLAVGPDGRVYVTDTGNGVVRVITP